MIRNGIVRHHPAHARGESVRQGGDPPCPRGARRRRARAARPARLGGAVGRPGRRPSARATTRAVLATDTQKNTVYAFAKEHGVGTPEEFALRLARHFLGGAITRARVEVVEVGVGASGRSRVRAVRARAAGRDGDLPTGADAWFVSGLSDLVVLKTTDSEFHGFPRDRYTTLAETTDRVLATAVSARWRHDGSASFDDARARAARHVRRAPLALAAADAVRDGLGGAGGVPVGGRGAAVDAQQAPLRRRPLAVRAGEPERGLPRRRPPVRADRGRRVRDGAPDPGPCWDPYPLV